MAHTTHHYDQPGQPGLEVVENESGLQVVDPQQQWQGYGQPVQEYKDLPEPVGATAEGSPQPPRRNIKKIIFITVVCVLVIVGIVVGAVVGTMKSESSVSAPSPSATGEPSDAAEMTGSPTSVAPGLSPTAISHGFPHLEIFALTDNNTYSIYSKYRNTNATDVSDFLPKGREMELVGGSIDIDSVPSIAVNRRIADGSTNRTEIHINGRGTGYRKYHDNDGIWNNDPTHWDIFDGFQVYGAPAEVQYEPSVEVMKVFYLDKGDRGQAAFYFTWHPGDNWSNAFQVLGPDLHSMTPSVIAWNGDDSRLDIFAVSRANNHLLHATWEAESDEWSEYEDLRGFVTTPPVAVSRSPGFIDVFARGGDAGVWHIPYDAGNGSWSPWTRISGNIKIQGQPDAISAAPNALDVFAWREDGRMLHKSFDSDSGRWTPEDDFEVMGSDVLSGPPKAVSDASGSIYVFAYNVQNELTGLFFGPSVSGTSELNLADVPMV